MNMGKNRLALLLFCFALAAVSGPAPGGSPPLQAQKSLEWIRMPVFFSLDKEPLPRFLLDFSSRQGVPCYVSNRITGTVSGRFNVSDSAHLLGMIARASGLQWYYDGGRVFYYASEEVQNASIPLRTLNVEAITELLNSVGAYDPRYELRSVKQNEEIILYVNAPPRYVDIIKEMVERFDVKPKSNRIMRLFRLRHAWARDQTVKMSGDEQVIPGVATTLQRIVVSEMLNAGVGQEQAMRDARSTVMPDMRLNAVIVWDDPERMNYFETLIRDLDQDTELVEIRCAIVDVGVDKTRDLGLGWGWERGDGKGSAGINLDSGTPSGDSSVVDLPGFATALGTGLNTHTIFGGGINKFMLKVHALESSGDAKVLSRPTVLTADNVQAVIERSETFYVRLVGNEDVALEEITYGTTLTVVPHIIAHPDGRRRIQMMINVTDGAETDTGEVDNIPRTISSSVNTQAVVGEGQALVIGGHYSEVEKNNQTGVPVLSKIPGFGALFRTKRKDVNRYERLFVISPRIITINDLPDAQEEGFDGAFTSHTVDEVYTMPSDSDSEEAIRRRAKREAEALEKGLGEAVDEDYAKQLRGEDDDSPANGNGNGITPLRENQPLLTPPGKAAPNGDGDGVPPGSARFTPSPDSGGMYEANGRRMSRRRAAQALRSEQPQERARLAPFFSRTQPDENQARAQAAPETGRLAATRRQQQAQDRSRPVAENAATLAFEQAASHDAVPAESRSAGRQSLSPATASASQPSLGPPLSDILPAIGPIPGVGPEQFSTRPASAPSPERAHATQSIQSAPVIQPAPVDQPAQPAPVAAAPRTVRHSPVAAADNGVAPVRHPQAVPEHGQRVETVNPAAEQARRTAYELEKARALMPLQPLPELSESAVPAAPGIAANGPPTGGQGAPLAVPGEVALSAARGPGLANPSRTGLPDSAPGARRLEEYSLYAAPADRRRQWNAVEIPGLPPPRKDPEDDWR